VVKAYQSVIVMTLGGFTGPRQTVGSSMSLPVGSSLVSDLIDCLFMMRL
jgi:hypothetical protein